MKLSSKLDSYKLIWLVDGSVKEVIHPNGRPRAFIRSEKRRLGNTTHKAGTLLEFHIDDSVTEFINQLNLNRGGQLKMYHDPLTNKLEQ